jgi:outer membrane receptor protein involved in Fe transport
MRVSRHTRRSALACSTGTILQAGNAKGVGVLILGLLVVPSGARAAEAAEQGPAISEVVVTAQKRQENLQDVPVAITAFTAEMRDKTGIVSAQEQLNFTPGVNYYPPTGSPSAAWAVSPPRSAPTAALRSTRTASTSVPPRD